MKVLILHPTFRVYGGAELAISKLSSYLIENGHLVDIYTLEASDKVREECKAKLKVFPSVLALRKELHNVYREYDIVNSHNHPMETLLYPVKHKHVWNHNELPEYVLWGSPLSLYDRNSVLKTVDRIIVFSEYNRKVVKEYYGMESTVIPFGVDSELFDRSKANPDRVKELGVSDDDFLICHPGWMSPFKNQLRTLLLYHNLKDKIPNIKILFTGMVNTRYAELVADAAKYLGNEDIIIHKEIGREILRDIYARSDVVVIPYRVQGGFLSAFQAMAMECNVIVSPEAPFIDLVAKHHLALITDDFETAVYNLYRGEIELPKNREWIKGNLTWNRYGERIEAVFKEVCSSV